MTTTRDIIERAYRKLGVVASDEAMTADQAESGLDALNAMMHGFALFGIDLEHADLALSDDFSLADRFHEASVYALAQRIAPDNMLGFDGDMFIRALQAAYMVIEDVTSPAMLVYPPSRGRRWTL